MTEGEIMLTEGDEEVTFLPGDIVGALASTQDCLSFGA